MLDQEESGIAKNVEVDVIIFATGFHIDRSTNEDAVNDHINKKKTSEFKKSEYQLDIIGVDKFSSDEWRLV